jgi:serine/threonine protein kinase
MHQTGSLLGGRYELTERIAAGGMGEVWRATDTVLGRAVAVKVLRTDNPAAMVSRFRDEARHMAALSHAGVARIHDYGEDGTSAYIVMELVPGEPLSSVVGREGRLPVATALSYLAQTAEALAAAHAIGVVHRDVKPGNLLVLEDGTIKVTDFGIARAVGSTSNTVVGQVIGTPQYMSPEQATGGTATPLSDVYALGAVGYELLVGHPPFTGDSPLAVTLAQVQQPPPDLPESIPAQVRSLIMRSLAKDPAERPPSAADFAREARDLQGWLTSAPTISMAAAATTAMTAHVANPATDVMPPALLPTNRPAAPAMLGDDFVRQSRKRGRKILWLVAAGAAVLIALVLLWNVSGGDGNLALSTTGVETSPAPTSTIQPSTTTSVAAVSTSSGPTVLVDPNALIGLNKREATQRLVALGFRVEEKKAAGHGNVAKDTVVGVEPNGQVPPGATITIEIAGKK